MQSLGHHEVSIVWSSQNQSWRYLHTLSLDATQLLRRRKIYELVAYIRGKNGEAVHIALAAFSTVLNLISTTFLSIDMIDLKSELAQELKDLISGLMEELKSHDSAPDFSHKNLDVESAQALKDVMQGIMEEAGKLNLSDFYTFLAPIDLQGRRKNRLPATTGKGRRTNPDILDVLSQLSREDDSKVARRTIKSFLLVIIKHAISACKINFLIYIIY
ncbi:hypothetical protein IEQ34_005305 [Dendrobium chrysotoxum]|uniref:Uncharacterized protein n=1 Tax=Dendrobium chrysotoxum TaxID=161865 RepID=A0AAV7H9R1_DENCH|nr:hypothetical protein IEQ34_005305 [Dendrobium chrysotoxum]